MCRWSARHVPVSQLENPARHRACSRLLARQMSLLLPHLGGPSHTLRSAIVTASGILLAKAFEREGGEESASGAGV